MIASLLLLLALPLIHSLAMDIFFLGVLVPISGLMNGFGFEHALLFTSPMSTHL